MGFCSCDNSTEKTEPSFETRILGNWSAVSEDYNQIAPEWAFFYEAAIKFYPDHSFAINVGRGVADSAVFKMGTWELKNNNHSIIFYSTMDDLGTVYRDTTEFKISIDSADKLILENDTNLIRHKRLE